MSSFKGLLLLKDSFIVFNLIRVISRIVSLIFIVFGFTHFIYPDGYLLIIVSYHLKKVKKLQFFFFKLSSNLIKN